MTARPGGWVDGIGWVALLRDVPIGSEVCEDAEVVGVEPFNPDVLFRRFFVDEVDSDASAFTTARPVIVTRWADGSVPRKPAKPDTNEMRRVASGALSGTSTYAGWLFLAAADYIDGVNP
jgi:hypothetical protein